MYMDYAVGDLLREQYRRNMYDPPDSWIDYGLGIITHIDAQKEIATIYWFEVEVSSYYKFRNMQAYLEVVSPGRA
jgi:hypothetical protein